MPEQSSALALAQPIEGEYQIEVKEFDAAGRASTFRMPVPANLSARDASIMLRTAILKRTSMKAAEMPQVLHAVMYADQMGLDVMAGEVYIVSGRIATTAGAKIRHAINSGRIDGYEVAIAPLNRKFKSGTDDIDDLKATVTVNVKGWAKPVVYETTLREWYMPSNPNWKMRPAYMLRRNALSKAFEEVAPMGLDVDEAPPAEASPMSTAALAEAIASK